MRNDGLFTEERETKLLATSQSIRLTCTLASFSGLFGLFLLFADRESRAVRHFAIQSVCLFGLWTMAAALLAVLMAVFSAVPVIGTVANFFLLLILCIACILSLVARVRMALFAYRGYSYTVPFVGNSFRRFEG